MSLNQIALGLVIVWIILVIGLVYYLLRKYTFNDKWTEENPNPYRAETLGIPRGVLRGILTLSVLFIVMLLEVNGLFFDPKDLLVGDQIFIPEQRFEHILVAFQMIIAFYFGGKVMHHMTDTQKRISIKKSEAELEQLRQQNQNTTFPDEGAAG